MDYLINAVASLRPDDAMSCDSPCSHTGIHSHSHRAGTHPNKSCATLSLRSRSPHPEAAEASHSNPMRVPSSHQNPKSYAAVSWPPKPGDSRLTTPFATYLYRSSYQTVLSVMASWFYGHYDCMFATSMVLFTSILYWHNAVNGWRRYADMCTSLLAMLYHLSKALMYSSIHIFLAYFLSFMLLGYCYHLARECSKEGNWLKSAYLHIFGLHSLGNLSNLLFYAVAAP